MLTSRLNLSGFETRLGSIDSLVTLGGHAERKDTFRPEAHILAHDGEVFINMRKPTVNRVDKPELINGRVEAICDGVLESFHITNDGEVEWISVYSGLPSSPLVIHEITDSANISYSKQIITPEQYANGDRFAKPEYDGCIVAYINGKRDNKYQTGKVWQCTPSKLYDSNGDIAWSTIEIYPDGRGKWFLVETLPWDWMKKAVYPVFKDPILGLETKGAVLWNPDATWKCYTLNPQQAGDIGTVTALKIWAETSGKRCKIALAEASNTGAHLSNGEDLAAEGAEINPTVANINSVVVTPKKDIVSGDWYRNLLYIEDSGVGAFKTFYDTGGPAYTYERNNADLYTDMPQDPVEATLQAPSGGIIASLWAEYQVPAVGGASPRRIYPRIIAARRNLRQI